jgi:hypothetical protein
LLKSAGSIPLDDYDGHVGAFTLLLDHLRKTAENPPDRSELMRRIRTIANRPGFDVWNPRSSREHLSRWAWIDPRSIAHSGVLGKGFPRGQYSAAGMSNQAQEILDNCEPPNQYSFYFDDPRYGYGIVVSSFAGPLGAIRPITTNGNHRSMAFCALGCPVVLAEVYDVSAPYRIEYNEDDDWEITRDFLKWQEERGALRFSSRSVVRDGGRLELRVAEAVTPWLAASPREALAALDAYERFWDQKLETVGPLLVTELRQNWKFAARREVRKRLREKDASAVTMVYPPKLIAQELDFNLDLGRP